jgi:hypothetical protein
MRSCLTDRGECQLGECRAGVKAAQDQARILRNAAFARLNCFSPGMVFMAAVIKSRQKCRFTTRQWPVRTLSVDRGGQHLPGVG